MSQLKIGASGMIHCWSINEQCPSISSYCCYGNLFYFTMFVHVLEVNVLNYLVMIGELS